MSRTILEPHRGIALSTWRGQANGLLVKLCSYPPSNLYTVKHQSVRMAEVIYQLVADTDEEAIATVQEMVDADDFNPEPVRWTKFLGPNG